MCTPVHCDMSVLFGGEELTVGRFVTVVDKRFRIFRWREWPRRRGWKHDCLQGLYRGVMRVPFGPFL